MTDLSNGPWPTGYFREWAKDTRLHVCTNCPENGYLGCINPCPLCVMTVDDAKTAIASLPKLHVVVDDEELLRRAVRRELYKRFGGDPDGSE